MSQSLFEFARRRNLKENEIEDILQVPSFKRLANDFDVNIKASHSQNVLAVLALHSECTRALTFQNVYQAGLQNAHPIVLMRIFDANWGDFTTDVFV